MKKLIFGALLGLTLLTAFHFSGNQTKMNADEKEPSIFRSVTVFSYHL